MADCWQAAESEIDLGAERERVAAMLVIEYGWEYCTAWNYVQGLWEKKGKHEDRPRDERWEMDKGHAREEAGD